MDLIDSLPYVFISSFLMLLIFRIIVNFLSLSTKVSGERFSDAYQGGELINIRNNRYATAIFPYTMYFLILHVLGFIAATIFSLLENNQSPLNWSTLFFGILMLYTILLVRKGVKS